MRSVQYVVRSVQYVLRSVQYVVRSVQYVVRSVYCRVSLPVSDARNNCVYNNLLLRHTRTRTYIQAEKMAVPLSVFPSLLRLSNGQAKVRYCHNAVAYGALWLQHYDSNTPLLGHLIDAGAMGRQIEERPFFPLVYTCACACARAISYYNYITHNYYAHR